MNILGKYGEKILSFIDNLLSKKEEKQEKDKVENNKTMYADCIIYNQNGEVLLLHRTYTDDFMNGKWGFPGGHVDESDKDTAQAAIRETKEETGLDVNVEFLQRVEKDDCIIDYYKGMIQDNSQQYRIILDNEEHRGYEWVPSVEVKSYDLIADLNNYVNDLLNVTEQTPEELSIDEHWDIIKDAFDKDIITAEEFLKARAQYVKLKKAESLEIITKAFDENLIDEVQYLEALELAKGGDPSHGGKLIKKIIVNKRGKQQTKWVDKETGKEPGKQVGTKPIAEQWWSHLKKYNLNAYPLNVEEKDVEINEEGDVDSHWVLRWKDPKSGLIKNAYTKTFLQRNADIKWSRLESVDSNTIHNIKVLSLHKLNDEAIKSEEKDAAAIVAIIAHTGLRRGDKNKFAITGNRGVSTLSAQNIEVKGDTLKFLFTGKSYQENVAEIKDSTLAKYIEQRQKDKKSDDFLFNTSDSIIDKIFAQVGGKGLKIKDMRTYVATDLARKVLFENSTEPPPLSKELSEKEQKKIIQKKLNECYQIVADKLNNTPIMAKNSYIHPNIVSKWMIEIGVNENLTKSESEESFTIPSLDELITSTPKPTTIGHIDESDEEDCDLFNEPEWLES